MKALIVLFVCGFLLRLIATYPSNIIIGFDQVRDLFSAQTIYRDFDLKIIGPTAGNNPDLHHGVLFLYYLVPPLILFQGNPWGVIVWTSIFNALSAIGIYYLTYKLFNKKVIALVASVFAAFSYYLVQYSGWISNPTVTLFTVPIFFLCLWKYIEGQKKALIVASFFLGLSIQFELFLIYLIPVSLIIFLIFRVKLPSLKIIVLSLGSFCLVTSTMIATEIKYHFAGVRSLLFAGDKVGGSIAFSDRLEAFGTRLAEILQNLFAPNITNSGKALLILLVLSFCYFFIRNKKDRKALIFLGIYLLSPMVMLILGYHNAPWFLIGMPHAALIFCAYCIVQLRNKLVILVLLSLILVINLQAITNSFGKGQILLEPDPGALLSDQLKAVDYTYQASQNQPFAVNSVTNPLYINALWAYHYQWYGKAKYGFAPTWQGGDQLHPYTTLSKFTETEKNFYLLVDTTSRIPQIYINNALEWGKERGNLENDKIFGGIKIYKFLRNKIGGE